MILMASNDGIFDGKPHYFMAMFDSYVTNYRGVSDLFVEILMGFHGTYPSLGI